MSITLVIFITDYFLWYDIVLAVCHIISLNMLQRTMFCFKSKYSGFSYSFILSDFLLLLVKDAYDYQGRSYLHAPQDIGVNLKSDVSPLMHSLKYLRSHI